jgi:putative tryptophan/tyrosine transport system substrate-binding protein
MRRREFIALIGGSAITWPLSTQAQQANGQPVVVLISGRASDLRLASEFRRGLSQTGRNDGQNVVVEYHWLDGHYERVPALLDDLIRRRVAVIATAANSPASLAAKSATSTIPIVFGVGEDPVALGLVASLAKPGGNATGINFFASEIDAKRLGLMHEMLPKAKRFAVLLNPANAVTAEATSKALKEAADVLGLELLFFKATTGAEIETAFAFISQERAEVLFIAPDGYFVSRAVQFAKLTARDRLPASAFARESVEAGVLMSYGTSIADVFRQVGVYAGSILNGAKPADLPVLQSTKFEFVINLQTARSLGIEVSPTLLARADEVIE